MTTYTNVFGGTVVYPSEVSYRAVTLNADTQLSWPTELATDTSVVAQIMDVTANAGPLKLKMPSAIDASVGETTLIFNVGSNAFTVTDTNANTIVSIAPGLAYQIYLTDNTTASGSWRSVQYGAGTSSATAGSLAGQGIKAIGTTLNQSMSVFTFSVNYTLGVGSDRSALYVWTGGAGTISLPLASDAGNDWFVQVRNSGTGALTVDPAGVDLINGSSSLVLNPGDSAIVACSGTAWFTIGLGKSASFTFDYDSISLTGQSDPYTLAGANLNRIAYNFGGTLTANFTVVVPTTIQQYWVTNSTSGGFNITVKTASGTGIIIAAGEAAILYCDGVNVVEADTGGVAFPISVANGGTGATTAIDARTNLSAAKTGINSDITSITALSAGGASGPAVTFAADPDSGMYSAGANQLGFSVNGVNAMTLTTSGMNLANALSVANGGTGVTTSTGTGSVVLSNSPTLVTPTLGAASATSIAADLGAAATPSYTFTGDLNTGFWSPGADILAASTGGSERMRISNTGNVSIGNTNNVFKLDVSGASTIRGDLNIAPSSGDGIIGFDSANFYNFLYFRNAGSTYASIFGYLGNGLWHNADQHIFRTNYASSTERMRITAAGNMGVGTSAPDTYGRFAVVAGAGQNCLYAEGVSNGVAGDFKNTGANSYGVRIVAGQNGLYALSVSDKSSNNLFYVDGGGNVGIGGVTSPGYKLTVNGRIASTNATAGLGYGLGAGGTVTQATSRTTGVTLNTVTGSITLVSAAGTATWQSFTVTNSAVAADDVVIVNQRSGTDLYMIHVTNVAAGSFQITFATTGGTTTEQPVFNFAVIKGATT